MIVTLNIICSIKATYCLRGLFYYKINGLSCMIQTCVCYFRFVKARLTSASADDEPDSFKPERYLRHKYGLKDGASEEGQRNTVIFGSGNAIHLRLPRS